MDHMIRAMAADDTIRAIAITSRELTETARTHHDTSPVVTAALGRMLAGAAMMGLMMKSEEDLLTLQVRGDGSMQGITVTADSRGHVKGFPNVNDVDLPLNPIGKLDVGGALGGGFLRVMRDTGGPEPYVGTVPLQTGEIAEDLTYYFAQSEQTPSAVGLGVLVDTDLSVACAGGFIVQLMPGVSDEAIDRLEANLKDIPSVTNMLKIGMTPEDIIKRVLAGEEVTVLEKVPVGFVCDCSRQRVMRSLIALPKSDIEEMIADGKPIEVRCQFCNNRYEFSIDDLRQVLSGNNP